MPLALEHDAAAFPRAMALVLVFVRIALSSPEAENGGSPTRFFFSRIKGSNRLNYCAPRPSASLERDGIVNHGDGYIDRQDTFEILTKICI
jgi:hypothetical protein